MLDCACAPARDSATLTCAPARLSASAARATE
jgi:hypothetical protein